MNGSEANISDIGQVNANSSTELNASSRVECTEVEILAARQLWIYCGSTIVAVGTIGHALSILVLLGSKRMRLLSLTVYLVATSFAGLLAIYVGLVRQVILYHSKFQLDVRDAVSDGGCKAHAMLTYLSLQLYSWLQASIAVERTIAVLRPLQYKHWCTWRRNAVVVVVAAAVLAAFNIIAAVIYEMDENGYCVESAERKELFEKVWGYFDLALYSVFPVAIIVPCNAVTLRTIRWSHRESHSSRKYAQINVMLVAQNCVCVATTLPVSAIFLAPWPSESCTVAGARRELEWTVVSLLQYLGTTFSFVIYSLSSRRFRRAIVDLFSKGFNANINSLMSLSSSRKSRGDDNNLTQKRSAAPKTTLSTDVLHGHTCNVEPLETAFST